MKIKKFIVCSDVHGDKQNKEAVRAFLDFNSKFKAEYRIFAGDLFDFRALRSKATPEERAESMLDDWNAGLDFLRKFNPDVILEGNHDFRLRYWSETKRGIEKDYAERGLKEFEKECKGKLLPYDKRKGLFKLGKLYFMHGFTHGIGACRKHASSYGNCIFGHTHAIDQVTFENIERTTAYNIGCLCELDLGYNSATISTLRQAHGWAYGFVTENDQYVIQARKVGNRWIAPEVG